MESLPYATPAPRTGARAWAGAAIVFGGMALVLLGGCFLIGVLGIVVNTPAAGGKLTGSQWGLMLVLYAMAFICFTGAAVMIVIGTRGLLRVLRG